MGEASWTAVPSKEVSAKLSRVFEPKSAVRGVLGLSGMKLSLQFCPSPRWLGAAAGGVACGQLQRLPVMGGLQVHSHGGHIYIGFI